MIECLWEKEILEMTFVSCHPMNPDIKFVINANGNGFKGCGQNLLPLLNLNVMSFYASCLAHTIFNQLLLC